MVQSLLTLPTAISAGGHDTSSAGRDTRSAGRDTSSAGAAVPLACAGSLVCVHRSPRFVVPGTQTPAPRWRVPSRRSATIAPSATRAADACGASEGGFSGLDRRRLEGLGGLDERVRMAAGQLDPGPRHDEVRSRRRPLPAEVYAVDARVHEPEFVQTATAGGPAVTPQKIDEMWMGVAASEREGDGAWAGPVPESPDRRWPGVLAWLQRVGLRALRADGGDGGSRAALAVHRF